LATPLLLAACFVNKAAAAEAGNLVKTADSSAVYYVDTDGKRWIFPNLGVYGSWFPDFSAVRVISPEEMAAAPVGGAIKYRPGTRLVKVMTDPKVYAVEPGGALRWLKDEDIAKSLYGSDWAKRVDDLPEAFFAGYSIGPDLDSPRYPDGTVLKRKSDGSYFLIDGLFKRRLASSSLLAALRVRAADVIAVDYALDDFPDGFAVESAEGHFTDASQLSAGSQPPSTPVLWLARPKAEHVGIGSDAVLLEVHAYSGSHAYLRRLSVRLDATTGIQSGSEADTDQGGLVYMNSNLANLTAVRLVDEAGAAPFGERSLSTDTQKDQSQTVTFDGGFELPAGEELVLRLMAKVNALLPAGEGYRATVLRDSMGVTDSAGTAVAFAPSGDLNGQTLYSAESKMQVMIYGAAGGKTYVRGAKSAEFGGFLLQAPATSRVTVRSMAVRGYVDQAGRGGYLPGYDADSGYTTSVRDIASKVGLYDSRGNLIGGPVEPTLDGRLLFTGLNFGIAAGSSSAVVLKGDLDPDLNVGESEPTRLTFDITDAGIEMSAVDESGTSIAAEGAEPNGGDEPHIFTTVRRAGKVEFTWNGSGGNAIAGGEILLGQLILKPEYDGYTLRTVSFHQVGSAARSMTSARLSFRSGSSTVSVTEDFIGNSVTFSGLAAEAGRDKTTSIDLFASTSPKDGGAVYGEQIKVMFSDSDALEIVSASDGSTYSENSLGTADFPLESNSASSWVVRFSSLGLDLSGLTPSTCYRDAETEVLRFTATASSAGPVRIRQIAFKVAPTDAGRVGAGNDALERWAAADGDFYNDYSIVAFKLVGTDETTVLGEDGSASVQYSVVSGAENASPVASGYVSSPLDYGVIRYKFSQGSEIFVPAGSTAEFSLFIDTGKLDSNGNYKLGASILGGSEFLWTDIMTGNYTPLQASDAYGVTRSASLICRI
jgi:hypothetical protein